MSIIAFNKTHFHSDPIVQEVLDRNIEFYDDQSPEIVALLKQRHLYLNPLFNKLYPRTVILVQKDKPTGRFVEEIPLTYLSPTVLRSVFKYDEEIEELYDGISISTVHQEILEFSNPIKLDFSRNNYFLLVKYINPEYTPINSLSSYSMDRIISVVYLDTFELYAGGLEIEVKMRFFQEFDWKHFTEEELAFDYLKMRFLEGRPVNLIITEMILPDSDGYQFATKVKELEKELNFRHVPIIALSSINEQNPKVQKGISSGLFIRYLSKDTPTDEMLSFINQLEL